MLYYYFCTKCNRSRTIEANKKETQVCMCRYEMGFINKKVNFEKIILTHLAKTCFNNLGVISKNAIHMTLISLYQREGVASWDDMPIFISSKLDEVNDKYKPVIGKIV